MNSISANGITLVDDTTDIVAVINSQIDKIRPIVHAHKGGVEIVKASNEEIIIGLKGHCAGCAMAPITFGKVLDKHLRNALPEIKSIKYVEIK